MDTVGKHLNLIVPFETVNDLLREQLMSDYEDADKEERELLLPAVKYYSTPQEFRKWRTALQKKEKSESTEK